MHYNYSDGVYMTRTKGLSPAGRPIIITKEDHESRIGDRTSFDSGRTFRTSHKNPRSIPAPREAGDYSPGWDVRKYSLQRDHDAAERACSRCGQIHSHDPDHFLQDNFHGYAGLEHHNQIIYHDEIPTLSLRSAQRRRSNVFWRSETQDKAATAPIRRGTAFDEFLPAKSWEGRRSGCHCRFEKHGRCNCRAEYDGYPPNHVGGR